MKSHGNLYVPMRQAGICVRMRIVSWAFRTLHGRGAKSVIERALPEPFERTLTCPRRGALIGALWSQIVTLDVRFLQGHRM